MKQIIFFLFSLIITTVSYAQFTDTTQLNAYLRDTIRDRRPDKVTAAQLQRGMLGISNMIHKYNFLNSNLTNRTGNPIVHNNKGQDFTIDSVPNFTLNLVDENSTVTNSVSFGSDGFTYFKNDSYIVMNEGITAGNLSSVNFDLDGDPLYSLGSSMNVSGLSGYSLSLASGGPGMSLSSGAFSISNIPIIALTGPSHALIMGSPFGLTYSNSEDTSFFQTQTGVVSLLASSSSSDRGSLLINDDSTSLSQGQVRIYLSDSSIALRDANLIDGMSQGKVLSTDTAGELTLVASRYRLGRGLTQVDGDSLFFGGNFQEEINLGVSESPSGGYYTGSNIQMRTSDMMLNFGRKRIQFSDDYVQINGGSSQQTYTSGVISVGDFGITMGFTDNYYNSNTVVTMGTDGGIDLGGWGAVNVVGNGGLNVNNDASFYSNANLWGNANFYNLLYFDMPDLQNGVTPGMFFTSDESGYLVLHRIDSIQNSFGEEGGGLSKIRMATEDDPYLKLVAGSMTDETDFSEISSIKVGNGSIKMNAERAGEYGKSDFNITPYGYSLTTGYWYADTPLDTTYTSVTAGGSLIIEGHKDTYSQHMMEVQYDKLTLTSASFGEYGETVPLHQLQLDYSGVSFMLDDPAEGKFIIRGSGSTEYWVMDKNVFNLNVPINANSGAYLGGNLTIYSRVTSGPTTTISTGDCIVAIDPTAPGAVTITFPDPTSMDPGRIIKICNYSTFTSPISTTAGWVKNFDDSNLTTLAPATVYDFTILDGIWRVTSKSGM